MSLILEQLQGFIWEEILESLLQDNGLQWGAMAALAGAYLLQKASRTPALRMPPGPRGLPLVGNLLDVKSVAALHKNFTKWRNQYGDVVTIHLGSQPCVILMTSDVIHEAFHTKGHDFSGRYELNSFNILTENGKDILMAQPTPIWKLQRRIVHDALRKYASGATLENKMESAFESFVYGVKQQNGIIDLPLEIMKMIYNMMSTMCFGKQFAYNDPWQTRFIEKFTRVTEIAGIGFISDFIPALRFLERKKLQNFQETADEFNEIVTEELREHQQHFDANCPRDLIDEILLQLQKQQDQPEANPVLAQMTEMHLTIIINEMFFAGSDTSRITLSIMIGLLVEHPEVQKKLHQELDDVLGDCGRVTRTLKDQLVYTNAVLHESMRLRCLIPVGFPHLTTRDTSLGKYTIPKDTIVIGYVHGVHTDPDNFKNPHEFNPDRWIDANGKFRHDAGKIMSFSVGPRKCPGQSLARQELLMFTAMLLHKYEFRPADESKPFKTPFKDIPFGLEPQSFYLKLVDRHLA